MFDLTPFGESFKSGFVNSTLRYVLYSESGAKAGIKAYAWWFLMLLVYFSPTTHESKQGHSYISKLRGCNHTKSLIRRSAMGQYFNNERFHLCIYSLRKQLAHSGAISKEWTQLVLKDLPSVSWAYPLSWPDGSRRRWGGGMGSWCRLSVRHRRGKEHL